MKFEFLTTVYSYAVSCKSLVGVLVKVDFVKFGKVGFPEG